MLRGEKVYIRALDVEDLEALYAWENDPENWHVSGTLTPYSKFVIREYIENSVHDIFATKQFRFIICDNQSRKAIGTIDLFEFDPLNKRAGVGILLAEKNFRKKGYALEGLELLKQYARQSLELHQLFCFINENNIPSIRLFEKAGYKKTGIKKDWIKSGNNFADAFFYQLIIE